MAVDTDRLPDERSARSATWFLYDARIRGILIQVVAAIAVAVAIWWIVDNTIANLRRANIASGFGFFDQRAGFDVSQSLIAFSSDSSYFRAFLVGLLNTLLVAVIGIVLASILGFFLGVARLSKNFLLSRIAGTYVEVVRNIPLLLQLLFWYKAVLSVLPGPRQGYVLPLGANLNNRGLFLPKPVFGPSFSQTLIAFAIGVVATFVVAKWARRRQMATGKPFPTLWVGLALIAGLPLAAFVVTGEPLTFDMPTLRGFNFTGGMDVKPEFVALLLGLVLYTAAFIGEVVRAGILAVSYGQREAAYALGLRPGPTLRLVIVPQAIRVIIPPLTNQYLNLTKNSSLAVAIGYPDLVSVFSGTVLNQTGQAVEVIFITMLVYLTFSLTTSLLMNWFNARMAIVER